MNAKLQKIKRRLFRELLDKSLYITAAMEVARSVSLFASNRNPLSFIEGGLGIVNVFADKVGAWSSDFFNISQGWELLVDSTNSQPLFDILTPILETFPSKVLAFHYNSSQSMAKIYTMPDGTSVGKDEFGIWHYKDEGTKEEMLSFLYSETYNSIHSQVFSIIERNSRGKYRDENNSRFILKGEDLKSIPSPTTNKHLNHLKSAIDKGIHRSVMFIGYPGSGKTTAANTIIKELGLRTLKFKYSPNSDMFAIEAIIDALKVDALILDDLDTIEDSISLLSFLERMHEKLKLTIGIVNSIDGFHAAIVRPARFDEIITINKLDAEVVREILGKKYIRLFPKVKNWPIAYLNELMERIKINPKVNITQQITELDKRVKNQIKALKQGQFDMPKGD